MTARLTVAGRGEAVEAKRARDGAPALTAIRYADPAAWVTVAAVAGAMEAAREAVTARHDRVGVVVTSAEGPVEAMAAMCEASRGGSSSPIRFPASNAGSLAGLTSIAFAFRGPTLMLTLPADRGVPVAVVLAEAWLRRGVVDYVAVAATFRREGAPVSRCLLFAALVTMGETPNPPRTMGETPNPPRTMGETPEPHPAQPGAALDVASAVAWLAEGR
jgi:hypothetical protein